MSRDANYQTATAVQEKVLDAIRLGQEGTLTAVREATAAVTTAQAKLPEWAEAFTTALPKIPAWAEAYTAKLPDISAAPSFDAVIGFTEKIWESQRDFNVKLYEAIAPVSKSAFTAAKDTAMAAMPATVHTGEQAAEPTRPAAPRPSR